MYYLILSNKYKNLNRYIDINRLDNIIDNSFDIIDKIIENNSFNHLLEITLIGGADGETWQNATMSLIEYIRGCDTFIKINLLIDNENIISLDQLKYCLWWQVNLIVYLQEEQINFNQIKLILNYKPRTQFKYLISKNNYNQLFNDYVILNNLNIQKLYFVYKNIDLNILQEEIDQVKIFIINNFSNNEKPLIPYHLHTSFFQKDLFNNIADEISEKLIFNENFQKYIKFYSLLEGKYT